VILNLDNYISQNRVNAVKCNYTEFLKQIYSIFIVRSIKSINLNELNLSCLKNITVCVSFPQNVLYILTFFPEN